MKKMSKAFGAVAVSAALALGCAVPAFAVEGVSDDPDLSTGDSSVNTTVKGYVLSQEDLDNSVRATVPLYLYVVTPAEGGDLTVPTNYYIKNSGSNDLTVSNIKASGYENWMIVEDAAALPTNEYLPTNTKPTLGQLAGDWAEWFAPEITTGTNPNYDANHDKYAVWMTMTAAGDTINLKDADVAAGLPTKLTLKAGSDEATSKLDFTLAGGTSVSQTIPVDAIDMIKVTYTVGAAE